MPGPGRVEIQEVDLPALGPTQVLVRTRAVGLCTMEQRYYRGAAPQDYPFHGGHEVSGEVFAVGAQAATPARPGDVVSLALLTRCGSCYYCRRGMDNFCLTAQARHVQGVPWGPAGLAEYVIAEDYQVFLPGDKPTSLPPGATAPPARFAELALAEPVACVVRSVQTPPLQFGDLALVQGAGIMGLLHVQLLRLRGARVIMSEPDPSRRQVAEQAGADWTVDPRHTDLINFAHERSDGRGANAAFFTAGGPAAIGQAIRSLAKGGWLCLYGSVRSHEAVQVDPNDIHYNELVVTGTFSHTKESFQQAVSLISIRRVNVMSYVSEMVPFEQVAYGFERALCAETYRVLVTFDMA
jgi:threonine dehydrogenase-like Zn-dependent dehydrogenase